MAGAGSWLPLVVVGRAGMLSCWQALAGPLRCCGVGGRALAGPGRLALVVVGRAGVLNVGGRWQPAALSCWGRADVLSCWQACEPAARALFPAPNLRTDCSRAVLVVAGHSLVVRRSASASCWAYSLVVAGRSLVVRGTSPSVLLVSNWLLL